MYFPKNTFDIVQICINRLKTAWTISWWMTMRCKGL
jgi:hypothetical protein